MIYYRVASNKQVVGRESRWQIVALAAGVTNERGITIEYDEPSFLRDYTVGAIIRIGYEPQDSTTIPTGRT